MDALPVGPQLGPVGGPAAWSAGSLDPGWRRSLTGDEVGHLHDALRRFERATPSLDLQALNPASFPLPGLAPLVDELRRRLVDGLGVAAFEGFPVDGYGIGELRAMWWGLTQAIGAPVAQSHRGDVIGDVRDLGTGIGGRTGRGYTSSSELSFHADAADVTGLFFLRTARSGGVNRVSSAVTTHDALLDSHPELLAELYRPLPWSWQGNGPQGGRAWYEQPVFGRSGPDLACAYVRTNILLANQNAGAPELTGDQRRAVQLVADAAAEPGRWIERRFEPGAMLFTNNHLVLHLRTAFTDWDDPSRKRHLLRVWLCPPNSRRLPDSFAPFFGDIRAGAIRGGYRSRTGRRVFETA